MVQQEEIRNSLTNQRRVMSQAEDNHRSPINATTEQHTCRLHYDQSIPAPLLVATPFHCRPPPEGPPNEMGTKRGEGHANHNLPDTTISFEVDGDTYSPSRLHIQPSDAIQGEEPMKGNDSSGGNTTWQLIYWHHQGERRRSRGTRGGQSPNHHGSQQRVLASPMRSQQADRA